MAWVFLVAAGLLEIVWAYAMKQSHGFSRLTPTLITLVAMIARFGLLSLAMRALPLGTAYTIWISIGAIGALLIGIFILGESSSPIRLAAAGLIVSGSRPHETIELVGRVLAIET